MATNFLWGSVAAAYNLLTTELNALADGSGSAAGPEIDNTANAYEFGRLHLHLASNSLGFTASSYCEVHLLPSNAGAAYPTYVSGSSYKLSGNYRAGIVQLNPAPQAANVVDEWLEGVRIPPGKFKTVLVFHGGGASAMPSSGNTLDLYPTPTQY